MLSTAVSASCFLYNEKIGIGTIISVFGIGLILQFTFKLLRFAVKNIKHESMADTVNQCH